MEPCRERMGRTLFGGAEFVLADAAYGAYPVCGKVFEGGAGSDAVVGIAVCGIVFVSANIASILLH